MGNQILQIARRGNNISAVDNEWRKQPACAARGKQATVHHALEAVMDGQQAQEVPPDHRVCTAGAGISGGLQQRR
jgi:hypothetical protein